MIYLPNTSEWNKYWVADIETNGLSPDKIWCVCLENLGTDEKHVFTDQNQFKRFIRDRRGNLFLVGHNFISFDLPTLTRLWSINYPYSGVVDTLVLDYLYNPKVKHALADVGERFGQPKVVHNDWSQYSEAMLHRCQQDVSITKRLYKNLIKKMKEVGFSEESIELEHRIREIVDDQERNGFCFDRDKAQNLSEQFRRSQLSLEQSIKKLFPPTFEAVKTYKYREKADGSPFESFNRHSQNYQKLEFNEDKTEYTVYGLKEFNIGSPPQRVKKLLSLGWEPTEFTKKTKKGGGGNPKIDEDELIKYANKIKDYRIKAIAEWLVLQGRSTMVEGWIKNSRPLLNHSQELPQRLKLKLGIDTSEDAKATVEPSKSHLWAIYGKVLTCGAQSRRMIHFEPNSANIPSEANGAKYGREVRELWIARPGRKLVGIDAKSCQPRLLLHYLKAPEWLQNIYLKQDFHQYNADNLTNGLGFKVKRGGGGAKTIYLAFIFGSGDPKLGSILKKGRNIGKEVRKILYDTIPGMEKLQSDAKQWYKQYNGWLPCLDGGWVRCPREHAAVNYLIQPAEAVVMKKSSTLISTSLIEHRLNTQALLVGFIHDEMIFDVNPEIAQLVADLGCRAIEDAGKHFDLYIGMEGDAKIGCNWHEVH